ncbi:putative alcohol dehydrogenase [Tricladium varicosporioides]|nr:putative alcohol dehydrogenase [Hymenoscyphus varicosporioides]
MPTNRAAYLPAKQAAKLVVKDAPYASPPDDKILIRAHAVAINPVDWIIPQKGDIMYKWLKYPFVLGFDVSGEVVEVGKNTSSFRIGDRVLGFAVGSDEKINDSSEGAFQEFVVLRPDLSSKIPSSISYESAAVIPLGLATAAAALFEKDQLNLQLPSQNTQLTGKAVLIWGGSTSVGCNAIQLATAAGYEVITTCSPANFSLVKSLGAAKAFDYHGNPTAEIIKAFEGKSAAGAVAIGRNGPEVCMEVLSKVPGNKFVSLVSYPSPEKEPESFIMLRTAYSFVSWIATYKAKGILKGVKSGFVFSSSTAHNGVGKAVFADFLPEALEKGTFVAAPEAMIIGRGLEKIQEACDIQRKGVSAKKVVVSL